MVSTSSYSQQEWSWCACNTLVQEGYINDTNITSKEGNIYMKNMGKKCLKELMITKRRNNSIWHIFRATKSTWERWGTYKTKAIGFIGGFGGCVLRAIHGKKQLNIRYFINSSRNSSIVASFSEKLVHFFWGVVRFELRIIELQWLKNLVHERTILISDAVSIFKKLIDISNSWFQILNRQKWGQTCSVTLCNDENHK